MAASRLPERQKTPAEESLSAYLGRLATENGMDNHLAKASRDLGEIERTLDKLLAQRDELREALCGDDGKCCSSAESKLLSMRGLADYFPSTPEGQSAAQLLRDDCDNLVHRFRVALARCAAPEAPKGWKEVKA